LKKHEETACELILMPPLLLSRLFGNHKGLNDKNIVTGDLFK